jgi:hypothetical protein
VNTVLLHPGVRTRAQQNAAQAEARAAELAAAEFRATDPVEQAITLLRRRGFPVCRASTLGGAAGQWVVGSRKMTADELLAMARRQANPPVLNAPAPIAPAPAAQSVAPAQEETEMPDIFRGMTTRKIRDDMELLRDRLGGDRNAAAACGMPQSSFGNQRRGDKNMTERVVLALYGPSGTTLRAELFPEAGQVEERPSDCSVVSLPVSPPPQPAPEAGGDPFLHMMDQKIEQLRADLDGSHRAAQHALKEAQRWQTAGQAIAEKLKALESARAVFIETASAVSHG